MTSVGACAVLAASAIPALAAASAPATTAPGRDSAHAYTTTKGLEEPLVLAHRGASGYRPEHTVAAYELAVAQGADYIEPDLVSTKDGVLVDRHEPEISGTSDVASHPEFASRKTTKVLDGVPTTGWFTEDFTLAELKTLRAKERLPQLRQENTIYDGRYDIPTFEELLKLRESLSKKYHRTVGIIPEIKHSTYQHANGVDPERELLRLVTAYGLNKKNAPLWVQSFELTNLLTLRHTLGYKANSVFLATNGGAPYDLASTGDRRTYADLLAPASLKALSSSINGIGPDKGLVIRRNADGTLGQPTSLVADAHAAGLKVTPYTFRAENSFLPVDYRIGTNPADYGRIIDEVVAFLKTGVDGVFCDQPDICIVARDQFRGR
ncbi:MAG: glycerophosphodiester phosphodiesterase [Dermatophilaceae bacterium]|nr:glycerophosphodiester phosphodiesterase [Dermatophilaceae bacterium]NUO90126.1 glycerophosphodiester phosphodiesterase [Dermatophilaceae bacterium]NUQ31563.1 glycerophosphodiester phosphodiesterase [Dermatophilaceae bacterium]NUR15637.1 glycerophosphodiester phosphodiesterase [Dermatophilaceae bacterium]NUR79811.1 glycerophosphodiester phosphodiesterase [Dermatophilaceae bacterium]